MKSKQNMLLLLIKIHLTKLCLFVLRYFNIKYIRRAIENLTVYLDSILTFDKLDCKSLFYNSIKHQKTLRDITKILENDIASQYDKTLQDIVILLTYDEISDEIYHEHSYFGPILDKILGKRLIRVHLRSLNLSCLTTVLNMDKSKVINVIILGHGSVVSPENLVIGLSCYSPKSFCTALSKLSNKPFRLFVNSCYTDYYYNYIHCFPNNSYIIATSRLNIDWIPSDAIFTKLFPQLQELFTNSRFNLIKFASFFCICTYINHDDIVISYKTNKGELVYITEKDVFQYGKSKNFKPIKSLFNITNSSLKKKENIHINKLNIENIHKEAKRFCKNIMPLEYYRLHKLNDPDFLAILHKNNNDWTMYMKDCIIINRKREKKKLKALTIKRYKLIKIYNKNFDIKILSKLEKITASFHELHYNLQLNYTPIYVRYMVTTDDPNISIPCIKHHKILNTFFLLNLEQHLDNYELCYINIESLNNISNYATYNLLLTTIYTLKKIRFFLN
jgi:hypothetical protein